MDHLHTVELGDWLNLAVRLWPLATMFCFYMFLYFVEYSNVTSMRMK
jgi:hypothetical protein